MKYILLSLLLSLHLLQAQNLITNGGFEESTSCPVDFVRTGERFTCKDWTSPNSGTPDYFNKCSELAGVPMNFAGTIPARSGNAYSGLVLMVKGSSYKEYLQTKLNEPLVKGNQYVVTFYTCWSYKSSYSIASLGVKFTETALTLGTKNVEGPSLKFNLTNNIGWEMLRDTFTAKGNEQYLLIGNFEPIELIRYKANPYSQILESNSPIIKSAYYLFDVVSVIELTDPPEFPQGEFFIGEGIYFDSDKYLLSDSSNAYLDRLIGFLNDNPDKKIKVEGHTDYYGSEEHNRILSEKRAEQVAKYLIAKGIQRTRISTKGWADTKLLDTSEEKQYKNRRIEIMFLD